MAKKNTITFSIITVVIIIGYVSLTGSNQWVTNNADTNLTKQPLENSQVNRDEQTYFMNITALIPPSEAFEQLINDLPLTNDVNISVDYLKESDYSYQNYVDFLLTQESGDIHLIPNEWVIPLAVQGYLMPLDRVVTTEYIEEQTNVLVDSMKWNSNIWAAPYQLDPYIVLPHQSISHFFEEHNEPQADADDIAVNNESAVTDEEQVEQTELLHTAINRFDALQQMWSTMSNEDILINLEQDGFNQLYQFLFFIDSKGITNGETLTEQQYSILTSLASHPSLMSEHSLDEIVSNHVKQPLFLVVKWSELSKYIGAVEKYYSLDQLVVPIHWTNGYSFVIKQQSKQHQIAGKWIEALHRKISDSSNINEGMPIQKNSLNQLQVGWQRNISEQFSKKLDVANTMNVSSKWPIFYEKLQMDWFKERNNIDRINMWLSYAKLLE